MPLAPGTRLGPYEIAAPLGAGGMGEVYRARDPRLARDVAIKVLPAAFSADPDRLRRFEQEARAAGALNHPNILSIHDIGSHDGAPYIVSELLEGETLRDRLAGGAPQTGGAPQAGGVPQAGAALPVRRAVDYAIQIARGLTAAHARGIVHRDLKPENVFVTVEGLVKILDFGLAKLRQEQPDGARQSAMPTTPIGTEAGVVMGTIGYMAPEQVRGLEVDQRADLFSLGAILYEMVAGRRAFRGDTAADTMSAILKEDPPDLVAGGRDVPPALGRIVGHCLEKNPGERYQSARDLAFALETISGVPSGSGAVARAGPGRGRWARAALAALALAAAIAIGFVARGIYETRRAPGGAAEPPSFQRLTFRRGIVTGARFASDGQTIVYSAAWDGNRPELFLARAGSSESRPLGITDAELLAISASGELAILMAPAYETNLYQRKGTLARVPMTGGAPRPILDGVRYADWDPKGKDLAVVRDLGGRWRLEFPIGRVLFEKGAGLFNPRVSPDGRRVAFFDCETGSCLIKIVDTSGRVSVLSHGWSDWWFLAWSPSGEEVWFAASKDLGSSALHAVDLEGRQRILGRMTGFQEIHDVARDGRVLLTQVRAPLVAMAGAVGWPAERELNWFDRTTVQDLSDDGTMALVSELSDPGGPVGAVYLRRTDGSPAVRLGEGHALALSSDGRWALAIGPGTPPRLLILPTGVGEAREMERPMFESISSARWIPKSNRVVLRASEPAHSFRLYLQDLEGGDPEPFTPEGVGEFAPTPDGLAAAAAVGGAGIALYPIGGGEPRPVPETTEADLPIAVSADGRALFIFRRGEVPGRIFRLDLTTGRRDLWRELRPRDPAGVGTMRSVVVTPDGRTHAYSYLQVRSELYLVEGLQ